MANQLGLEPRTTDLEAAVLPIKLLKRIKIKNGQAHPTRTDSPPFPKREC
jgi:hypothetical protein